MKINWFSNAPWAASGYGVQTKLFAPRLKEAGHEIGITAFYGLEGSVINWNGIQIYPRWAHTKSCICSGVNQWMAFLGNWEALNSIGLSSNNLVTWHTPI